MWMVIPRFEVDPRPGGQNSSLPRQARKKASRQARLRPTYEREQAGAIEGGSTASSAVAPWTARRELTVAR